jgi:hypothetical protein
MENQTWQPQFIISQEQATHYTSHANWRQKSEIAKSNPWLTRHQSNQSAAQRKTWGSSSPSITGDYQE